MDDDFLLPAEYDAPAPPSTTLHPWHARLPFDVAMGDDPTTLCERFSLDPRQLDMYLLNAAFRREVAAHQKQFREEGVTFRAKAKLQAEMYLEDLHDLVVDKTVAPATRLDAIKSVVKWAGLEPKVEKDAAPTGGGGGTKLVISWQDGSGAIALQTQ